MSLHIINIEEIIPQAMEAAVIAEVELLMGEVHRGVHIKANHLVLGEVKSMINI